jgi:hypothetical protein
MSSWAISSLSLAKKPSAIAAITGKYELETRSGTAIETIRLETIRLGTIRLGTSIQIRLRLGIRNCDAAAGLQSLAPLEQKAALWSM